VPEVLIIDDHPLIRDAVRRVFEHGGEWTVSDVGNYEEALDRMAKEPILDLVLLDLGLPGQFGLDALRDFRDKFPESPCVVLSGQDDAENIRGAIDLGAMGFISKRSSGDAIMGAIGLVLKGYVVTPRDSITRPAPTKQPINPMQLGLTGRQCEVLAQLVLGKSNKVIARALDLTEATIKTHILAIFRVLGVHNRTGAVMAVSKMGMQLTLFERPKL
jgi:DNA-binding NarL/FixJ family response regulator